MLCLYLIVIIHCDFCYFQGEIVKELSKARLEIDNVKRQMLQQEIAFNIQQTDALTRYVSSLLLIIFHIHLLSLQSCF